jgi:hypothetical protein
MSNKDETKRKAGRPKGTTKGVTQRKPLSVKATTYQKLVEIKPEKTSFDSLIELLIAFFKCSTGPK